MRVFPLKLAFPWPDKSLSPNSRVHWATKAKAFKAYKQLAGARLSPNERVALKGQTKFKLVFSPPDKRRRDADNLIASFKAGFDKLAELTGVDDSKFEWTYVRGNPVENGAVYVEVLG